MLRNIRISKFKFCSIASNLSSIIQSSFNPTHFELINESHLHSVPKNSETHFKAIIISDSFIGKSHIERHQLVHKILGEDMKKIHALSLICKLPSEWSLNSEINVSPKCKGGSKHEKKDSE